MWEMKCSPMKRWIGPKGQEIARFFATSSALVVSMGSPGLCKLGQEVDHPAPSRSPGADDEEGPRAARELPHHVGVCGGGGEGEPLHKAALLVAVQPAANAAVHLRRLVRRQLPQRAVDVVRHWPPALPRRAVWGKCSNHAANRLQATRPCPSPAEPPRRIHSFMLGSDLLLCKRWGLGQTIAVARQRDMVW